MSNLLQDLRTVAATSLQGSELPTHVEVQDLLGAVIKTLDVAGITVAKDLLPAPEAAVAEAAVQATGPIAETGVSELLAKIHELEAKLEGKPAQPAASAEPATTGAPAAPPIEGAN